MKTTTIGRIGAIVAGAAMLGTAVASAFAGAVDVPSGVTKGFFVDATGAPLVQVAVGEKAQASDGAAAGQIAAMIGNMAFGTTTVSQAGGTMEVQGGTTTCVPSAAECSAGTGAGQVKLSWAALGMIGDLEQRQMDCDIYSGGMEMLNLTDGGDEGNWADLDVSWPEESDMGSYVEIYTPEDTVANTMVGSCEVTSSDVSILKTGEFPNEICSICYNFCDIALGCEPHMMSEFVEIYGDLVDVVYDCTDERLEYEITDGAVQYNVFTDDIVTEDVLGADDITLVAQSYLGKIILGQHEYYVEDLDDNSITIVCGGKGTVTTSAAMTYVPPAEGSACDAADSGQTYSIRLVGAQTIEEKGVVDVTLEVTKPDGTTEQVTSGISGTPVVGDIKVKLQRGTAASNVITGEQSFSADVLVWYVPSEYTFNIDSGSYDGTYNEAGEDTTDMDDDDVRAEWLMTFNGDDELMTFADVLANEDGEDLDDPDDTNALPLPDGIDENNHWDDCYEDAGNTTEDIVLRYIQFELQNVDEELPEGDLLNLPFNDGKYLLSDLKFGYKGLYDDEFRSMAMQDTTEISVAVDTAEVYTTVDGDTDFYDYRTAVTLTYVDENGEKQEARIDEGPFQEDDVILMNEGLFKIKEFDYEAGDIWNVTYNVWEDTDWNDDEYYAELSADNNTLILDSQVNDTWVDTEYSNAALLDDGVGVTPTDSVWYMDEADDLDDGNDELLYIDAGDGDETLDLVSGFDVTTEFEDEVDIDGGHDDNNLDDGVTVRGVDNTGAEDSITYWVDDSLWYNGTAWANKTESEVWVRYLDNGFCELGGDCDDIATGEDDGTLLSLSGAIVDITGDTDVTEPTDDYPDPEESEVVTEVVVTVPENEMRPTLFFGTESTSNSSSVIITEADLGTEVDIGGIPVTVEAFGVSVSGGGVVVGGTQTTITCPSQTATCPAVSVATKTPASIGYKVVILDSETASKANLILVGGPAVNEMTKDLVTVDELCNPKTSVIKQATANKLVVAGCDAADTVAAADALVAWLKANAA